MARITYLDGLRGWAALLVVTHHLMLSFYPALYWKNTESLHTGNAVEFMIHGTPLSLFANGGLAVALFLILSGYVLMMQFKKTETTPGMLTYFTLNRFVRFFLLMLVTNILAYLAIVTKFSANIQAATLTQSWGWLGSQWQMVPSFFTALSQSFMGLFYMYPIDAVYNSSIWTMPLFFLGGFLVTLVFHIASSLKHRWVLYGLLLLILLRGNYYLLIVGMMLYEFTFFSRSFFSHPLSVALLLGVFVFFGGYPYVYQTSQLSPWYSWLPLWDFTYTSTFYHGISATALVVVLINSRWLQRLFSLNLFTYFGARSFSLYLVHIIVILSVTSRLFITFITHYSYSVAVGMSILFSLIAMWGLTELLYQLIEKRSGAVIKQLYRQITLKVQ